MTISMTFFPAPVTRGGILNAIKAFYLAYNIEATKMCIPDDVMQEILKLGRDEFDCYTNYDARGYTLCGMDVEWDADTFRLEADVCSAEQKR